MYYARWATKKEMSQRLTPVKVLGELEKSGIPLMYDESTLYLDEREAHSLVIGATGSGKTQATILPLLNLSMRAKESIVLNDPNGAIYRMMKAQLEKEGYQVVALDFSDARYGNNWNPLDLPYRLYQENKTDQVVKALEKLGYYLLFDISDSASDPFWVNSAIDFFIGLVLYLFEYASKEEIHLSSVWSLAEQVNEHGKSKQLLERIRYNSLIYLNLSGTLNAPPETRGSIVSVFRQKIKKYISRESLVNLLVKSDFDIVSVSAQPTALFIISGNDSYCNNLIPLVVDQIMESVELYGEKTRTVNILLDEFDSLVPIKEFSKMIDWARSCRVRFTVVVKSYNHLISMYGKENTELLKMCFGNIIYLLSSDIYTLDEVSNMCGRTQLKDGKVAPLITVEELKVMNFFEAVVLIPRMMPFRTKLLPNYKIDWGYETLITELLQRETNEVINYQFMG